jgi:ribosomal protein S18 acetylase RimI-like enzyme
MARQGQALIRVITRADISAISALCLATAAMGEDAAPLYGHPELPGLVWALPYAALSPETCFVAEIAGRAAGYIVACSDTREFEARLEAGWWPELRRCYPEPTGTEADRTLIARLHAPRTERADIVATHPAHLHINLLPEARGRGLGRALLAACLASIHAQAIHAAIHVDNHAASRFFTSAGFTPLGPPRGVALYLGRTLPNR